jgi:dTDP-D-glucose 4,6-dehydratase
MVVGNGMIANRFAGYKNNNDTIIFASGVSNSGEHQPDQFARERLLLEQVVDEHAHKLLVYFSTCSIADDELQQSPYVIHKKSVEAFITANVQRYQVFRVSNVAGVSNNPYTLLNYFIFNILQNHPLTVWKNASRNIIGIDDLYAICDCILQERLFSNSIVNVANRENYPVPFIIEKIEAHLHKKAICNVIDKGGNYQIDTSMTAQIIDRLHISFDNDYLPALLKKYYHSR